jgi:predicted nucleic acid-binding protein
MSLVCIDSNLLIWGIQKQANSTQEDMIPKTIALLEFFEQKNANLNNVSYKLAVPTIVLGEFLLGCESEQDRKHLLRKIQERFRVLEYNVIAAKFHSEVYNFCKGSAEIKKLRESGTTRVALKADFMIYATAKANQANLIITHDDDLLTISQAVLDSHKISVKLLNELVVESNSEFIVNEDYLIS